MRLEGLEPDIKIENVVASVTLDQEIDLMRICRRFPHTEYDPRRFPGLIYRLKRPKATALLFNSGKMVVTGAKSEREAHNAVRNIVRRLNTKGIVKKNPKVRVEINNVVASANLFTGIDLEKAAEKLDLAMYEPEEFPGIVYQMREPRVVVLVFATGNVVCTGARKKKEVLKALDRLRKELREKNLCYRRA